MAEAYRGELIGARLFVRAASAAREAAQRRAIEGLGALETAMAGRLAQGLRAFGWAIPSISDDEMEAVLALYPIATWEDLIAFIADEAPPALIRFQQMPALDLRLQGIAALLVLHEEALIRFGVLAGKGALNEAEEAIASAIQKISGQTPSRLIEARQSPSF